MMLRSPGEARRYPSIWLSTGLAAPFVLGRLVVLALIATGARSTERGRGCHGPRMIFQEKIGMIFVLYSRRGSTFDFLLSIISQLGKGSGAVRVICIQKVQGDTRQHGWTKLPFNAGHKSLEGVLLP